MSHRYSDSPDTNTAAKIGETWIVERRDGSTIRLTLGERNKHLEWFYPNTLKVYEEQDLVGLLRRTHP